MTVTIPIEEYERLCRRDRKLQALEEFGVDNWSGYGDALGSLEEDDHE